MDDIEIHFPEINYSFPMVFVEGTENTPYLFGDLTKKGISIEGFLISKFPVTQRLWKFITGNNPSYFAGPDRPVENVSFDDITQKNGFLNKLNLAAARQNKSNPGMLYRLPSETEWEYAARGGKHWADDFKYSGGNDINEVGWFEQNSGKYSDPEVLSTLKNHEKGTATHDVGQKLPNQLGIFDMSGHVWEWCADAFQPDIDKIPDDGTPYLEGNNERVLRGGCHHNWAVHCTVSKRYAITPEAKDECIGFRIAMSI
ncbi:MAG TPA: formylglycine-generating enzyme family protein [Pedobacter sp.]|uniref:formylglycine-generating enzyme family protein n=1 Tax=Pedobacter sp. TaxID=1411316 RepID=UPI002BE4F35C|nr:formylglycine-generating enzyme family protein [Pedobacter sp.]HMI05847.1 formylglycine-generating enzyme family protein [Pedobacter sp.]